MEEWVMPYIVKKQRERYYSALVDLEQGLDESGWIPGHVVYVFYRICFRWFQRFPSFNTINAIRGVLASTVSEFDRCLAADYEDNKRRENGDV
jgi:hypothetical protein